MSDGCDNSQLIYQIPAENWRNLHVYHQHPFSGRYILTRGTDLELHVISACRDSKVRLSM